MKINVLLEGGVGDLMLATRFVGAVREAYPSADLTAFVNNEGNEKFNSFIQKHWGHLWNRMETDVKRASTNFTIVSQFGQEVYNGAYENIDEDSRKRIEDCDRFYNFHLDALKFTEYDDIAWQKWMKFVPRPQNINPVPIEDQGAIIINLYARPDHFSAISQENSEAIIDNLAGNKIIILAPSEGVRDTFYAKHKELVRVTSLDESLDLIAASRAGVSIDSGLRCMFYPFGKPCFTLCKLCSSPFQMGISHVARWYMWPEHLLPVDAKPSYVAALVSNALDNSACGLYPQYTAQQIDNTLLKRRYA